VKGHAVAAYPSLWTFGFFVIEKRREKLGRALDKSV
jgi:hypothetical protein